MSQAKPLRGFPSQEDFLVGYVFGFNSKHTQAPPSSPLLDSVSPAPTFT